MKTYYTLGFLLSEDLSQVMLLKKQRPAWQCGKLNGIGGHVEENETPNAYMAREFAEETTCNQTPNWSGFATMRDVDFEVFCFAARANLGLRIEAKTDEELHPILLTDLSRFDCVENIQWLIELAKDHLKDGLPFYAYIDYP